MLEEKHSEKSSEKKSVASDIMASTIDIKWFVAILIPFGIWMASFEVRLSSGLPSRVTNLEVALQPVLIEYGVDKELEARGLKVPSPTKPPMAGPPIPTAPKLTKEEEMQKIRVEKERELREQFPNAYKK